MKYYSPLIAAALATASLFRFSLPVFAVGTSAGLELKNTATATYENEDGSSTFEAISNDVTVTVGKIAGITNVPSGFVNETNSTGTVNAGNTISFDFLITNTGNDTTDIFIPDVADIGLSSNLTILPGTSAIQYRNNIPNTPTTNFTDRPSTGLVPNVVEDGSIIVRVRVIIDSGASDGDTISVTLGDTGLNDNGIDTQNQPDNNGAADPQNKDVRTVTAADTSTDVDGDPVNGQREASAKHELTVGSNPLAFTRIEKTNTGVVEPGTDPSNLNDDVITYNLELDVADDIDPQIAAYKSLNPSFNFNAADLEGRNYNDAANPGNFNGIGDQSNLILISDVIPVNTTLDTSPIISPANWTPVFTDDPLTTAAEKAQWEANIASLTNPVTRIGWVYDAGGNGVIAAGSTTTGFSFKVVTSGLNNTAASIYNMSQVFGSTDDGAAGAGGAITFDESGDQNPNNFNDDGTPGPDESVADGGNFGFANPGTNEDNVDTAGDNTATGSDAGEVNKITVALPPTPSNLLNGPDGNAGATGDILNVPTPDDNHDFQNKGASTPPITAGTNQATTFNPVAVDFNNTIENSLTTALTNVIIEPVSPADLNLSGTAGDLPNNTRVTITYQVGATINTAVYDYNGTIFTLNTTIPGSAQIVIPNINGGGTANYSVSVDLPATALSTSEVTPGGANVGGYPVPIAAYVDDDGTPGLADTDTYNVTFNQVYLGYLKLEKQARILRRDNLEDPTSTNYSPVAGMGFNDPNGDKFPIPGDRIEYQVTFTNISEPQGAGNGNVTLRADDIFIAEDGTLGDNNWAEDSDTPNDLMDTLNVPSSAAISGIGAGVSTNITFQNAGAVVTTTDQILTKYEANIAELNPGESGIFTFQRKVTEQYDIETLIP
ncbi:hypothetical protein [Pleurocapsa sp. PCC 7319]|uniref:beta strand repeat-containing protein n=1 Tax=Pleurocapsa sp. PCC 7319 TaxID=118161 RepID=UPI00130D7DC3|nr:hypothetical protein [Pleurocapsa sp. PCC 7319]